MEPFMVAALALSHVPMARAIVLKIPIVQENWFVNMIIVSNWRPIQAGHLTLIVAQVISVAYVSGILYAYNANVL